MTDDARLSELIENTLLVYEKFNKLQRKDWTIESMIMELSKQVGDLAKRVMMFEKYYLSDRDTMPAYSTGKKEIGDELSDIFYCIVIIANYYKIDLGEAHMQALREALIDLHEEVPF